jgi:hypothetical protein
MSGGGNMKYKTNMKLAKNIKTKGKVKLTKTNRVVGGKKL